MDKIMKTYYVYKTQSGQLKLSNEYCAHEFKIKAATEAAAKAALTRYKKQLKKEE